MEIQLEEQELMLWIILEQVVKADTDIGLRVCRRSWLSAKAYKEDDEGKALLQSRGEAISTHRFNVSIVPKDLPG